VTTKRKPIKYYSAKRRAIYARGDSIDALTLFNMFDWKCYLCSQSIDPRRRCPDWRAATIEHIIPLCEGGTHTWDNVVPAHARCNFDKADSLHVQADVKILV
jgi:5-methylcytosine-specific restriction endonuclease McrA